MIMFGRTRIRFALLLIFGLCSIFAYAMLAITINAQPAYKPFPGWVAIIQPKIESLADKITLQVSSGISGNHPYTVYTVAACGPGVYSGDLILGGKARLNIEKIGGPIDFKVYNVGDLPIISGFVTSGPPDRILHLGAAQIIPFTIPQVPCGASAATPGTIRGWPAYSTGYTLEVAGRISAPIEQRWHSPWRWWHSPAATESWPLVGGIPGLFPDFPDFPYSFTSDLNILQGEWRMPRDQELNVNAAAVSLTSDIVSTIPAPSASNTLAWSSTTAISPMAKITDSAGMEALQQWLVVAGVGLGIGGSMLASLVFDWLRPPVDHRTAAAASKTEQIPETYTQLRKPQLARSETIRPATLGALIFTAALVIRWRRRSNRNSITR
jgi:hypothetical protein